MKKQDFPWVQLIWQAHRSNGKVPQSSNACGSFRWKDYLSPLGTFLQIAQCKPGVGDSVRSWKDNWCEAPLNARFPHFFSFRLDEKITLQKLSQRCNTENIDHVFYLPLSVIASQQFEILST
jgi:hypothetical protein